MKTQKGFKLVKVDAQGVQFGNAWFSHESITGYTADQLNAGTCGVTGGAYMAWLSAESPADSVEGCYEHALKAMEGEADRLRAASIQAYDEAKERELFEAYALEILGPYFMKPQKCLTRSGVTYTYGQPATAWCAWQACAKSRAGIQS